MARPSTQLQHTWSLLQRASKPSLAAMAEALLRDWASDPQAVDIEGLLARLRLGNREDPNGPNFTAQLGHLVWWEQAKIGGTHLGLGARDRSTLGTAFELGVVLLSTGADHPHLQEASLTDVHEAWVRQRAGDDSARAATLRERLVLLLVVEGKGALAPDLYVIARRVPGDNDESPPPIGVIPVRLHHALERAERGEIRKDIALTRELEPLAGLVAHGGDSAWREPFLPFDRKRHIDRFRTELRGLLEETMDLLEQVTGMRAGDAESLAELREAASLLVFRVFFVAAMERRGLLYSEPPRAGEGLRGLVAAGDDAKDSPFLYLQDLSATIREGKSVTGRRRKPAVAIKHASIFRNRPTEDFSEGLASWLDKLDAETAKLAKQPARLKAWDRLITRLEPLAQGQVTRYEFEAQEAEPIGGGNAHVQRVLGDVYEQILAMIPVRTGKGTTGKVQLTLTGKPRAGKHTEPTNAKELKSLDKAAQSERKALGAHYTPEALVTEVVLAALEPVFAAAWTRAGQRADAYERELLELRVLDPAMGSAHFLTVAALEIARELAWAELYGRPRDPEWFEVWPEQYEPGVEQHQDPWSGVEPADRDELDRIAARRLQEVTQACCYGVDVKPLAVELGKLALWMLTMVERQARGAARDSESPPLTFVDKNLRCGDSLRGTDEAGVREFFTQVYGIAARNQGELFKNEFEDNLDDVLHCLFELHDVLSKPPTVVSAAAKALLSKAQRQLGHKPTKPAEDVQGFRLQLHEAARELEHVLRWTWDLRFLYDWYGRSEDVLWEAVTEGKGSSTEKWVGLLGGTGKLTKPQRGYRERVRTMAAELRAFHWPLEFYDVFHREPRGFDVIVTNPPFLGSQGLRAEIGGFGVDYLKAMVGAVVDLCGVFFSRFGELLNQRGVFGSLAPNSIAQAKMRRLVLRPIGSHFDIYRSCASRPWPGDAAVHISTIHALHQGEATRARIRRICETREADDTITGFICIEMDDPISSYLDDGPETEFAELTGQDGIGFQGMISRGNFDRPLEFAEHVPRKERRALYAYLNNRDVQQQPSPTAQRIIIDVSDALAEAGLMESSAREQERWLKSEFPVLHAELGKTVKPERMELPDEPRNQMLRARWWLFEKPRPALRAAWDGLDAFIIAGRTGKHFKPTIIPRTDPDSMCPICPTEKLYVIPTSSHAIFGVFNSFSMELLTRRLCSTLKSDMNFAPTDVLPYFPFPWPTTSEPTNPHRAAVLDVPAAVERRLAPPAQALLDLRKDILLHPERHDLTRAQVGGPTDLYNLFDDPTCEAPSIKRLRSAHHELERAVLREYGWEDLHGPWTFERPWIDGTWRHVPPAATRRAYLTRLAELNHERAKG